MVAPAKKRSTSPKDAATLILVDRTGTEPKILMGKRHSKHSFMPDTYVFPGGRLDRGDFHVPFSGEISEADKAKMSLNLTKRQMGVARISALAIAAIRECYEEAGIMIGRHQNLNEKQSNRLIKNPVWKAYIDQNLIPDLTPIHFFARAITPPMRTKRFDARFFVMDKKFVTHTTQPLTDELSDLRWIACSEIDTIDVPMITRAVFSDVEQYLNNDTLFDDTAASPFYIMEKGQHIVKMLSCPK